MQHVREMTELVDLVHRAVALPPRPLPRRVRACPSASSSTSTTASISSGSRVASAPPASRSRSATSARTSRRRASTTCIEAFGRARRRTAAAHLGSPARPGHRGAPRDLRAPAARRRRRRPRRVAAGVPEPGHRPRRVRSRRRDRRAVGLGRELAARHPRGAAGARARHHRGRRRHGRVRPPRGERPPVRAPRSRRARGADAAPRRRSGARASASVRAATCSRASGDDPGHRGARRGASSVSTTHVIARRDSRRVTRCAGPWRITFDTNPDTCNLQCVMCEEHSPHSLAADPSARRRASRAAMMPIELVRARRRRGRAARACARSSRRRWASRCSTTHFDEIIDLCREHGVKLNLTTNGTFPRLGARAWAERIVPGDVGREDLVERRDARRRTSAIMLGARLGARRSTTCARSSRCATQHAATGGNRCRVTFQLTFLETNVGELADDRAARDELGVDRVKGHHLWAHFDEHRGPLDAAERRRRSAVERRRGREARDRRSGRACFQTGGRSCSRTSSRSTRRATSDLAPGGACPFLGQEAWVSAAGSLRSVLRARCAAADARRVRQPARQRTAAEIWNSDAYQQLVADVSQPRALPRLQHASARGRCRVSWERMQSAPERHPPPRTASAGYTTRASTRCSPFHAPGLAPVRRGGRAWHIDHLGTRCLLAAVPAHVRLLRRPAAVVARMAGITSRPDGNGCVLGAVRVVRELPRCVAARS